MPPTNSISVGLVLVAFVQMIDVYCVVLMSVVVWLLFNCWGQMCVWGGGGGGNVCPIPDHMDRFSLNNKAHIVYHLSCV